MTVCTGKTTLTLSTLPQLVQHLAVHASMKPFPKSLKIRFNGDGNMPPSQFDAYNYIIISIQ